MDTPPNDPEDWSDDEWRAYLAATAEDADAALGATAAQEATGFRKLKTSAVGSVVGAGMMGLQQALYGELPKEEVVVEAESGDPDRDRSVFDPDDPGSATISLTADPTDRAS